MTQTRSYTVVLQPEPDGGYSASVPAFPEIAARGDDEAHVLHEVREAIEGAIAARRGSGERIPAGDASYVRNVTVPLATA